VRDPDWDRSIAERKKKREPTGPLKWWAGERILYVCDEDGCMTKAGVFTPRKEEKPRRRPKLEALESQVLPRRNEPGDKEAGCIRFQGLDNREMRSDEVAIPPGETMAWHAQRRSITIGVSKAERPADLDVNGKQWTIYEGGIFFLARGSRGQLTNNTHRPISVFEVSHKRQ
jgi:quercetin dioxygenase-like cupin family protein